MNFQDKFLEMYFQNIRNIALEDSKDIFKNESTQIHLLCERGSRLGGKDKLIRSESI